jgi:hypothetical protein
MVANSASAEVQSRKSCRLSHSELCSTFSFATITTCTCTSLAQDAYCYSTLQVTVLLQLAGIAAHIVLTMHTMIARCVTSRSCNGAEEHMSLLQPVLCNTPALCVLSAIIIVNSTKSDPRRDDICYCVVCE